MISEDKLRSYLNKIKSWKDFRSWYLILVLWAGLGWKPKVEMWVVGGHWQTLFGAKIWNNDILGAPPLVEFWLGSGLTEIASTNTIMRLYCIPAGGGRRETGWDQPEKWNKLNYFSSNIFNIFGLAGWTFTRLRIY